MVTIRKILVPTDFSEPAMAALKYARALAEENRYQFQYWALGLVDARPAGEPLWSHTTIGTRSTSRVSA